MAGHIITVPARPKNYLSVYLSGSINASKDSDKAYACPASFSKSNSGGIGTILGMYYNSNAINSWASGKSVTYLWDANDSATFYRATTTKYQYNFSRWTDWSDWSDWSSARRSTSDSLKEDTQVKYFIVNIEPEAQKFPEQLRTTLKPVIHPSDSIVQPTGPEV